MFSDSLLESGQGRQSRRCLATCLLFSLQAIGVSQAVGRWSLVVGLWPARIASVARCPRTVSRFSFHVKECNWQLAREAGNCLWAFSPREAAMMFGKHRGILKPGGWGRSQAHLAK